MPWIMTEKNISRLRLEVKVEKQTEKMDFTSSGS